MLVHVHAIAIAIAIELGARRVRMEAGMLGLGRLHEHILALHDMALWRGGLKLVHDGSRAGGVGIAGAAVEV